MKVLNTNSLANSENCLRLTNVLPVPFLLETGDFTEFHPINNGAEEVVYPSIYFLRWLFVILFQGRGCSISLKDTLCK